MIHLHQCFFFLCFHESSLPLDWRCMGFDAVHVREKKSRRYGMYSGTSRYMRNFWDSHPSIVEIPSSRDRYLDRCRAGARPKRCETSLVGIQILACWPACPCPSGFKQGVRKKEGKRKGAQYARSGNPVVEVSEVNESRRQGTEANGAW